MKVWESTVSLGSEACGGGSKFRLRSQFCAKPRPEVGRPSVSAPASGEWRNVGFSIVCCITKAGQLQCEDNCVRLRLGMSVDGRRTCLTCGWVYFGVSRSDAEKAVASSRACAGGEVETIDRYERCFRCGGSYLNFRRSETGDLPDGCTVSAIISPEAMDL